MMELQVCVGSSCHIKGSYHVIQAFQALLEEHNLSEQVEIKAQFCMKRCQYGVSVCLDGQPHSVSPQSAHAFFQKEIVEKLSSQE